MENSKKGSRAIIFALVCSVITSIMGSLYLGLDTMMLLMNLGISAFVVGKFSMAMMFTQGWKVFNRKTILGMPMLLFLFYLIVGGLLISLFTVNNQIDSSFDSAQRNIFGFVISASVGVISTFIAWYSGINAWMAQGSEYDARAEFTKKGFSKQLIEEKIGQLREYGLLS